jgi:hypothetical protein
MTCSDAVNWNNRHLGASYSVSDANVVSARQIFLMTLCAPCNLAGSVIVGISLPHTANGRFKAMTA